jgi:transposase
VELPIVGIDIAKAKFDMALFFKGKVKRKVGRNTQDGFKDVCSWLSRHVGAPVHACLEATGNYGEELAIALVEAGHVVSIVNPAQVKAFGKSELLRTKTDQVEAELIGRFCAAMRPVPWAPPAPELRELQALVRRLDALIEIRAEEKLRLKTSGSTRVKGSIQDVMTFLDKQIAALEKQIRTHFNQHPDLKSQRDLLTSIPGIGEYTAAVILAEARCLEAFTSARQLVAYSGLAPQERMSGSSVRGKTRICKIGNARLRRALYMPALSAKLCNRAAIALFERMTANGKARMAAIAAIMRKLLVWSFGVLKSGRPFSLASASA